jgi:hypothetical protein
VVQDAHEQDDVEPSESVEIELLQVCEERLDPAVEPSVCKLETASTGPTGSQTSGTCSYGSGAIAFTWHSFQ